MKIVVIVGARNGKIILTVTIPTMDFLPLANTMINRKEIAMKMNIPNWKCEECIHSTQETTDDVACCNCCEDGSFFEEYKGE